LSHKDIQTENPSFELGTEDMKTLPIHTTDACVFDFLKIAMPAVIYTNPLLCSHNTGETIPHFQDFLNDKRLSLAQQPHKVHYSA
jgi:hypothetical protein